MGSRIPILNGERIKVEVDWLFDCDEVAVEIRISLVMYEQEIHMIKFQHRKRYQREYNRLR